MLLSIRRIKMKGKNDNKQGERSTTAIGKMVTDLSKLIKIEAQYLDFSMTGVQVFFRDQRVALLTTRSLYFRNTLGTVITVP